MAPAGERLQAFWNSFPAATIMCTPFSTASFTASSRRELAGPPKDILQDHNEGALDTVKLTLQQLYVKDYSPSVLLCILHQQPLAYCVHTHTVTEVHLLVWTTSSITQYFNSKNSCFFGYTISCSSSSAANMSTMTISIESSCRYAAKICITINTEFCTTSKVYMSVTSSTEVRNKVRINNVWMYLRVNDVNIDTFTIWNMIIIIICMCIVISCLDAYFLQSHIRKDHQHYKEPSEIF